MTQILKAILVSALVACFTPAIYANPSDNGSEGCEKSLKPEAIEYGLYDMDQFRVRIMPVGMVIHQHGIFDVQTGADGIRVSVNNSQGVAIPFLTWEGLSPTWTRNEDGEGVLVAVDRNHELQVMYPFSPDRPAHKVQLVGRELVNAQVARGDDGRILIVVASESQAEIFLFQSGTLRPLAFGPYSAPLSIEPGEKISAFGIEQVAGADGRLIIFTNWRTLRYSRRLPDVP